MRVIDGDTIDVDVDLGFYVWIRKQRIRLLGIDAPEVTGETRPEGLAATEHLKTLIEGKRIILRTVKGRWRGSR
jgi:micrococcal nuclease